MEKEKFFVKVVEGFELLGRREDFERLGVIPDRECYTEVVNGKEYPTEFFSPFVRWLPSYDGDRLVEDLEDARHRPDLGEKVPYPQGVWLEEFKCWFDAEALKFCLEYEDGFRRFWY